MNELTSVIHTAYTKLKNFDCSKKPLSLYLTEDLPLDYGNSIQEVIQSEKSEKKTVEEAKFIEAILQKSIKGIDPKLSVFSKLNFLRKKVRNLATEQKLHWKNIVHTLQSEYLHVTKKKKSALNCAIKANLALLTVQKTLVIQCDFPDELWLTIFQNVSSIRELKKLGCVCKRFSELAGDPFLQKAIVKKEFSHLPSYSTIDAIKKNVLLCKHIRTNNLKEDFVDDAHRRFWHPRKTFALSNGIVISCPYQGIVYIFSLEYFQNLKVLNQPHTGCVTHKNSIFLLKGTTQIYQVNAKTFLPEEQFEIPNKDQITWLEIKADDSHIYLKSKVSLCILDRKKKEPIKEIPLSDEFSEYLVANGLVIGHSEEKIAQVYPERVVLEELRGCTPHSIQGTYLLCLTPDWDSLSIFDLRDKKLVRTLQRQELIPQPFFHPASPIVESNNILYMACGTYIFIWDLVQQKHIKTIYTDLRVEQMQIFDHFLCIANAEGLKYIDLTKNVPQNPQDLQNPLSFLLGTVEKAKDLFFSIFQ